MSTGRRDDGDYGPINGYPPAGGHWKYLEPTHLVGAFVTAVALSLLWTIVCLIGSMALYGSPWGALLGPVLGTAHAFVSLRAHLRARQRAFEGDV